MHAPWIGIGMQLLLESAYEAEKVCAAVRHRLERGDTLRGLAGEAGVPVSLVHAAARLRPGVPGDPDWIALSAWAERELPGFHLPPVRLLLSAAAFGFPVRDQPALRSALVRTLAEYLRAHDRRLPAEVLDLAGLADAPGTVPPGPRRDALLAEAGHGLSARELGRCLGLSPQGVTMRRERGALLGVRDGTGPWRYPAFQLTPEGAVPEHLPAVLRTFRVLGPWEQLALLLRRDPALGPGTLMDRVRAGERIEAVRERIQQAEAEAEAEVEPTYDGREQG